MQVYPSDLRPFSDAETPRADRLLRAAVSGYCELTRPRRYDAQQLQDLAMPLIGNASHDTLRYIAAALSNCETEPYELVRELARLEIAVAAPLLARSRLLTDTDLIVLIGTRGLSHARAIAKRPNLNPSIAQLIRLMNVKTSSVVESKPDDKPEQRKDNVAAVNDLNSSPDLLIRTRERLRSIMLAAGAQSKATAVDIESTYETLRDSVLERKGSLFAAALSDALGISAAVSQGIVRDASCEQLALACRAIGLREEQAFLIASAQFPLRFPSANSIRHFVETYRSIGLDRAEEQLRFWQTQRPLIPARSLSG